MARDTSIAQVRNGMDVHTADGQLRGTVVPVWFGRDSVSRCQARAHPGQDAPARWGAFHPVIAAGSGTRVVVSMLTAWSNDGPCRVKHLPATC